MARWKEEEEHLLRLLIPTNSYAEIAEEIKRRVDRKLPGFSKYRTEKAIRKKCIKDGITPENYEGYVDPYEARWNYIKSLTDEYKEQSEIRDTGILPTPPTRKILSLSDIHFPFAKEDMIMEAIRNHSDADIVVLNGDILDGYIFSTYKRAKRIAALKEYIAAFELVKMCSEIFPNVVIVSGNHDERPAKALQRAHFEKDQTQVLRPDLLARIANGERLNESGELVEKINFTNVHYSQFDPWYVRVGKTVFAHPSAYSSGPGATAKKLSDYFIQRIGNEAFDSVVLGHTHKIFKGIYGNKLLIEQGALCDRQPYQHKSDLRFLHAMNGYAVIYQDDEGNTDFNKSHVVYLGSMLPVKKAVL